MGVLEGWEKHYSSTPTFHHPIFKIGGSQWQEKLFSQSRRTIRGRDILKAFSPKAAKCFLSRDKPRLIRMATSSAREISKLRRARYSKTSRRFWKPPAVLL